MDGEETKREGNNQSRTFGCGVWEGGDETGGPKNSKTKGGFRLLWFKK